MRDNTVISMLIKRHMVRFTKENVKKDRHNTYPFLSTDNTPPDP